MARRVHMGCGLTHLEGWINCDGSLSARMAGWPQPLRSLLRATGWISGERDRFLSFLQTHPVQYVNAHKTWPFATDSVDVIYSCHVIDCFTPAQLQHFFSESWRVLKPGGAIRLAGIDLEQQVQHYLNNKDAKQLVTMVSYPNPSNDTMPTRIKKAIWPEKLYISHLDFNAYASLLHQAGFVEIINLPAGQTTIEAIDPVNLWQRQGESLYVEARKPSRTSPA